MALRAYITNFSDGTVSVIDIATNTVIATVTVLNGAQGLAINPAGTKVYVASNFPFSDAINIIDTCTNEVATLSLPGSNFKGVAVTPDNSRIYVANNSAPNDAVEVIDAATNLIIASVPLPLGSSPIGIVVSHDGTRTYVANLGSNTVSVIDSDPFSGTYNTIINVIALPPGYSPQGIEITPADDRLYVTGGGLGGNIVLMVDIVTEVVTSIITSGMSVNPYMPVVTPDGQFVYVSNALSPTVSVIQNSLVPVLVATISGFPSGTFGIDITPDGQFVYTANRNDGTVSVVRTSDNTIVGSPIDVGNVPIAFGKFIGDVNCPLPPSPTSGGSGGGGFNPGFIPSAEFIKVPNQMCPGKDPVIKFRGTTYYFVTSDEINCYYTKNKPLE